MKNELLYFFAILVVMVSSCGSDMDEQGNNQVGSGNEIVKECTLTGKKWYATNRDYFEFFDDGTNTYQSQCTYFYDKDKGRILFYKDGSLINYVNVIEITDSTLSIENGNIVTYTTKQPVQICEKLTLPYTKVILNTGDDFKIMTYIEPIYANDKSITVVSTDNSIVSISGETIHALAPGCTTVIVSTNDGSRLSASFEVLVFDSTYRLNGVLYPMIEPVDLGLPSGTLWANMNLGADASFKMSNGFDSQIDVTSYVGSGWQYPTEADFKELIDNCDVGIKRGYSDFYSYYMHQNHYFQLVYAVLTSRINGKQIHLYANTETGRYSYAYPYCLNDGSRYYMYDDFKLCFAISVMVSDFDKKEWDDKLLIRLVKK